MQHPGISRQLNDGCAVEAPLQAARIPHRHMHNFTKMDTSA
jgi:hypothetical protein